MSTKRVPLSRVAREPLSAAMQLLLETGETGPGDFEVLALARDTAGLRALWHAVKDEILAAWIAAHPGSRPHAWWAFCSPEPERRRLGGTGSARHEVLAVQPSVQFGVETDYVDTWDLLYYTGRQTDIYGHLIGAEFLGCDFLGIPYNASDPPRFESEAAFLRRLGLLSRAEAGRLTAADFEPERVTPGDAEEETRR